MKQLFTLLALIATTHFAAAQYPTVAFQPVGTTGNLLTSESRDHWAKIAEKLKAADRTSDRVTQTLGLPPVHAVPTIAAAKAAVPKIVQRVAEREATVLLTPDRPRGGLKIGSE